MPTLVFLVLEFVSGYSAVVQTGSSREDCGSCVTTVLSIGTGLVVPVGIGGCGGPSGQFFFARGVKCEMMKELWNVHILVIRQAFTVKLTAKSL